MIKLTDAEFERLTREIDREDIKDIRKAPYWYRICEKYNINPLAMTVDFCTPNEGDIVEREAPWKTATYWRQVDNAGHQEKQVLEVEYYSDDMLYLLLTVNGLLRQKWVKTQEEADVVLKDTSWKLLEPRREAQA